MCYKVFIFSALSFIFNVSLWAQADHAWISTGKVRARITPTGIHRDTEGGFLLEKVPGQPVKNLLSHLTPWVGGIDPGNNIRLACEIDNPLVSDWRPGFRGVPNSGKVWKVTLDQIATHLADYQDNGVVDNPILEIFAWPAKGNPFSESNNGFSMDSVSNFAGATFMEPFIFDGKYNPENGDYPAGPELGSTPFFPQEMVFAPFFDDDENNLSHGKTTGIDAHLLAFSLNCKEQDAFKNTIFFEFGRFYNASTYRLDSLHWGVYADFDLGNPEDDYLGSLDVADKKMVYSYNSDTTYDNVIGTNPPAIAFMSFPGPLDQNDNRMQMTNCMPIYKNGPSIATRLPIAYNEFYNYLTSTWRDGTPLSSGGIGYHPGIPSIPTAQIAFPDHPTDVNGWSELAENNTLSDRSCVISYGPTTLLPHQIALPIRFAITVSEKLGLTQQLQQLKEMRGLQEYIYNGCWDCPNPLDSLCFPSLPTQNLVSTTRLSPNPTQNYLTINTYQTELEKVFLVNALGQNVLLDAPQFTSENEVRVSLKNLPAGIYFLHWISKDGRRGCEMVVKN